MHRYIGKLEYGRFICEHEHHIGKMPVHRLLSQEGYRGLLKEFERWLRSQYKFTKRPPLKGTNIFGKPGLEFSMEPLKFEVNHE